MFWIGAAAGAFACLVLICGGFGVLFWQVARERQKSGNEADKWEKMYSHWAEANDLAAQKNYHLKVISIALKEIAKTQPTVGE